MLAAHSTLQGALRLPLEARRAPSASTRVFGIRILGA
jgi:hypothetical protein